MFPKESCYADMLAVTKMRLGANHFILTAMVPVGENIGNEDKKFLSHHCTGCKDNQQC